MRIFEITQQPSNQTAVKEPGNENKENPELNRYKVANGQLPPEIALLKGPDGLYNTAGVTRQMVVSLMQKYPKGEFWGISQQGSPGFEKTVSDIIARLVDALSTSNQFITPKSRFFHPDRPMPANALGGYRGDSRTGRVENTARPFDPQDINFYMGAFKWARNKQLVAPISPAEWLMILLTEGRDDFGFNIGQWHTQQGPRDKQFAEQLTQLGMTNSVQLGFVGIIKSKQDAGKRTGKSFYELWNGGAQHLANYNAQAAAVKDPRNKPLLDLITQALA